MDTILIDAKKTFTTKHLSSFTNNLTNDTIVTMYIEPTQVLFEETLVNLKTLFKDEKVEQCMTDDCVVSLIASNKVLQFYGSDFLWWIDTVRGKKYKRLDRLFNTETVKSEKKNVQQTTKTHKCACAIKENNNVTDIETFEGSIKDVCNFVNHQYQYRQIRSFFKSTIVFCVNYIDDTELNNIDNWFTYDELVNKGVFVI